MSPNVEQILIECSDARLVMTDDGQTFTTFTLTEAAGCAKELAAKGFQPAGVIATLLDGDLGVVSEPGHGELMGRVLAAFLLGLSKQTNSLAWCEALGRLKDPR